MYHASYTPDYFCQLSCNPNNYSSSPSIFGSENTRVGGFAGARGVGDLDLVVVLVDDVLLYFSEFVVFVVLNQNSTGRSRSRRSSRDRT